MPHGVASRMKKHRLRMLSVKGAFLFQFLLLSISAPFNLFKLNADSVAYIRIADYYAKWDPSLMISGYWGPLLSWLTAPFLYMGMQPLVAMRMTMGISAMVFLYGCVTVLRNMNLPPGRVILGAWTVATISIFLSTMVNSDLLLAGFLSTGIGLMLKEQWVNRTLLQFTVGLIFGLAYLAKPIGFVFAIILSIFLGLIKMYIYSYRFRDTARAVSLTLVGFLIFASPWILTLSLKYKRPVFTTSAGINHTIIGPVDVDRYHPLFRSFHRPHPGRVTQWEDPSEMNYLYWSPFEKWSYLRHQLNLIRSNLNLIPSYLLSFDIIGLGLFALVGALLLPRTSWQDMAVQKWRWAGIPVFLMCSVYVPVFAGAVRYYYFAYPFLIAASFGLIEWFWKDRQGSQHWKKTLTYTILIASFLCSTPPGIDKVFCSPLSKRREMSDQIAKRLKTKGYLGPIANIDCAEGLFISFFAGVPYYGSELKPSIIRVLETKAKIVIVKRDSVYQTFFDQSPQYLNLDTVLFSDGAETETYPFVLYRPITSAT